MAFSLLPVKPLGRIRGVGLLKLKFLGAMWRCFYPGIRAPFSYKTAPKKGTHPLHPTLSRPMEFNHIDN
jgi:hypothetical protein